MSADEADAAARNAARRLTPTERLHEVTMAAMTRAAAPPEHSGEVTRNAKGHFQFGVTVRSYDLDDLLDKLERAADRLDKRFPYPNGGEE